MPNFMAEMGVVGLGSNTMRDSVVVGRIGKRKGETKRHRSHHELFSGGTLSTRSSFLLFFCPQSLRPDCPNVAGRSSVGRWPIWSSRSSFSLPLKVRTPCGSSDEKEKEKRGGGVSQKTVVAVVESFSTHVAGGGGRRRQTRTSFRIFREGV